MMTDKIRNSEKIEHFSSAYAYTYYLPISENEELKKLVNYRNKVFKKYLIESFKF